MEAGRENTAVVEDEKIGGVQIIGKGVEAAVLDLTCLAAIDQKPRLISRRSRSDGNPPGIEYIIKDARIIFDIGKNYFISS